MNAVLEIINTPVARLQEAVFLSVYLPKLISGKTNAFNVTWINEVSKNPYGKVDIINPAGVVLFSVPPISKSLVGTVAADVSDKLNYLQKESDRIPLRGAAMMTLNLPELIAFREPRNGEFIEEWNAILGRYGYTITVEEADSLDTASNVACVDEAW